jgi:hypothetical protein
LYLLIDYTPADSTGCSRIGAPLGQLGVFAHKIANLSVDIRGRYVGAAPEETAGFGNADLLRFEFNNGLGSSPVPLLERIDSIAEYSTNVATCVAIS